MSRVALATLLAAAVLAVSAGIAWWPAGRTADPAAREISTAFELVGPGP